MIHIKNTKEIGARLKAARKRKGMTGDQLSEESGVRPRARIMQIESGNGMSYDTFEALCDALEVDQAVILGEKKA